MIDGCITMVDGGITIVRGYIMTVAVVSCLRALDL